MCKGIKGITMQNIGEGIRRGNNVICRVYKGINCITVQDIGD